MTQSIEKPKDVYQELLERRTSMLSRANSGIKVNRHPSTLVRESHFHEENEDIPITVNGKQVTKEEFLSKKRTSIVGIERTSVSRPSQITQRNELRKTLEKLSRQPTEKKMYEVMFKGQKIRVSEMSRDIVSVTKAMETHQKTEENYYQQLEFLNEYYLEPLKTNGLMTPEHHAKVFFEIKNIFAVTQEFNETFKLYETKNEELQVKDMKLLKEEEEGRFEMFCTWFLSACDMLKVYKRYMYNLPFAMKILSSMLDVQTRNQAFYDFCQQQIKKGKEKNANNLYDIKTLIQLPQNHLPKYVAKFKEIFKIVPSNSTNKQYANQLVIRVTELLDEINDYITVQEQLDGLTQLTDRIEGLQNHLEFFTKQIDNNLNGIQGFRDLHKDERVFIDEFDVGFWRLNIPYDSDGSDDINVFCEGGRLLLFTDCVLLCSSKGLLSMIYNWNLQQKWRFEDLLLFDHVSLGNEVDEMLELQYASTCLSKKRFDLVSSQFFNSVIFVDREKHDTRDEGCIYPTANFTYIWPIDPSQVKRFKNTIGTHFKQYYNFVHTFNQSDN